MSKKTIEEYINTLKNITEKMKNSELTLDDSMKLYKEGLDAAAKADKLLADYRNDLEILNNREESSDE